MKILKVLIVVLILKSSSVQAQQGAPIAAGVDVGSGVGNNSWAPSITYHEEIGSQRIPWLRIGLGFRAWGHYSGNAELQSRSIGGKKEYMQYRDLSVNGLSFLAGVTLSFWKLDIGVNTDLVGISYGTKRHGLYNKTSAEPVTGVPNYGQWLATRPSILNVLPLWYPRSSGQSEAFIRAKLTHSFGIKLGYLYGRTSYATREVNDEAVYLHNNQRFISKVYGLPYIGLAFAIGD